MPEPEQEMIVLDALVMLARRVERIEREVGDIVTILGRVIEHQQRRRGEPVSDKGPEPVATPGAS